MKHQQAIVSQRVVALQEGIKASNKYLFGIYRMINDKENLNTEEIDKVRDEIDELMAFLDWLAQQ